MMASADPLLKIHKTIRISGLCGHQPISIIIKSVNIISYVNISLMILKMHTHKTPTICYK